MGAYVFADVTEDPKAAERVKVDPELRQEVVDLGFERAGFLATHGRDLRFVAEVFGQSSDGIVAATYNIGGDGCAFWTLLDDGTIVTSENIVEGYRLFALFTWIVPILPRAAQFFARAHFGSPSRVLAKHRAFVRRRMQGGARPVMAPPMQLYAAMRMRFVETTGRRIDAFASKTRTVWRAVMALVVLPFTGWTLYVHGWRAALKVLVPLAIIGAIVSGPITFRVMLLLIARQPALRPPAADAVLARASDLPKCRCDELPRLVGGSIRRRG